MAIIDIPKQWRKFKEAFGFRSSDDALWKWGRYGFDTTAGPKISEENALENAAVWNAITILSTIPAMLPLNLYQRQSKGKQKATDHPYHKLLWIQPNPEMTAMPFREAMMGHLLTWGNAYIEKEWAESGYIKALWPIPPNRIRPERSKATGRLIYYFKRNDGTEQTLTRDNIIHIPAFGGNGLMGYSPIRMHKEALGLAKAMEEFGAGFFGRGATPGAVLQHPETVSEEAQDRLKKQVHKAVGGLDNAHRLLILEEGMTWNKIGLPPEEAQFIQSRTFEIDEVARIYNLPPHLLKQLNRATFSNIEELGLEFVDYSLMPWLKRVEQNFTVQMHLVENGSGLFYEHNVDALLRGNITTRYAAYAQGRQWGWLSADDIRELENMNPLPDGQGEMYLIPMNMTTAEAMQQQLEELPMSVQQPLLLEEKSLYAVKKKAREAPPQGRKEQEKIFYPLFKNNAQRLINKEVIATTRALNKYQRDVADTFNNWLDEFYQGHNQYVIDLLTPVYTAYAKAIRNAAGNEIGKTIEETETLVNFLLDYIQKYADRHTSSSIGQIRSIMNDGDLTYEEKKESVIGRLEEWNEKRAEKIANDEVVRSGNAIARAAWATVGITQLQWVNTGSKTCDFCVQMNGKVVGIEEFFLSADESIEGQHGGEWMKITGPKSHPPIHQGCVCMIVPKTGV